MNDFFDGRLALQQRVLPSYRIPFFDLLAGSCSEMQLFAGMPRPVESIASADVGNIPYHVAAGNMHLLKGGLYVCYQTGLGKWLNAFNPDALIVEANPRYLSTPAAIRWMKSRGKKVIGWGLGAPVKSIISKLYWSSFVNQFDAMISYSQRGADEYAALGVQRNKLFTAHNSVSLAPEKKIERPPIGTKPVILFVGRLQARKRVDFLLRACAEINTPLRLIIVGDGPERVALEALAKEVYPSAEFVGAKHGNEAAPYFEQADLFVLPGTGGLAVQEAMSFGLPIIVAKGDGTQDDLVRAGNGWQIEPENYDALVAAMKNALSDTTHLRKMGDESFRIVKEEVNLQKMAGTFVRALNFVTGK